MPLALDKTHSAISFAVRHMMISKVKGSFADFSVTADIDPDAPAKAKVQATIEVRSIDTGANDRDTHLRSGDFFDVEKHPTITFASTAAEKTGEGTFRLTGDLTIRAVTKPVTFDVEVAGPAKDPWGNTRWGFTLKGKLQREDFGLTWNQALETGGVLVGKEVALSAEIQLIQS
jgi:polyisoprenoid-binding protein YceI